jgi:hypothetical protein
VRIPWYPPKSSSPPSLSTTLSPAGNFETSTWAAEITKGFVNQQPISESIEVVLGQVGDGQIEVQ